MPTSTTPTTPTTMVTLPETLPRLAVRLVGGRPVVRLFAHNATTEGASWAYSYDAARKLYAHICTRRRANKLDHPFGRGRRMSTDGGLKRPVHVCATAVRIGCQRISYDDIATFAASQHWPTLPPRPKRGTR